MKTSRLLLLGVAVLALIAGILVLIPFIVFGPLHDFIGRRNTVYSSPSTVERYPQIKVGDPREEVVELLGEPIGSFTITNYPVWALRDAAVRRHYGTNSKLQIEALSFSRAKHGGDYDDVSIWIGPNEKVIRHERWVTD